MLDYHHHGQIYYSASGHLRGGHLRANIFYKMHGTFFFFHFFQKKLYICYFLAKIPKTHWACEQRFGSKLFRNAHLRICTYLSPFKIVWRNADLVISGVLVVMPSFFLALINNFRCLWSKGVAIYLHTRFKLYLNFGIIKFLHKSFGCLPKFLLHK